MCRLEFNIENDSNWIFVVQLLSEACGSPNILYPKPEIESYSEAFIHRDQDNRHFTLNFP